MEKCTCGDFGETLTRPSADSITPTTPGTRCTSYRARGEGCGTIFVWGGVPATPFPGTPQRLRHIEGKW